MRDYPHYDQILGIFQGLGSHDTPAWRINEVYRTFWPASSETNGRWMASRLSAMRGLGYLSYDRHRRSWSITPAGERRLAKAFGHQPVAG